MKIRILDDSFRFRITSEELDQLRETGLLLTTSRFPGEGGDAAFTFGIRVETRLSESRMESGPRSLHLRLSEGDLQILLKPEREGVYLKRQWEGPGGKILRAIAFVEKERRITPPSGPEAWIYQKDDDADRAPDSYPAGRNGE